MEVAERIGRYPDLEKNPQRMFTGKLDAIAFLVGVMKKFSALDII